MSARAARATQDQSNKAMTTSSAIENPNNMLMSHSSFGRAKVFAPAAPLAPSLRETNRLQCSFFYLPSIDPKADRGIKGLDDVQGLRWN